jgi:acetyltransferase
MTVRHLDALLAPRSVVVVGASDRPGSVGATVWRNITSTGFDGRIEAVNPSHTRLGDVAVHARCADVHPACDLAVICTPPATVPGLVAELAAAGTRAAIVMTAGLDAATRQAALDAARPTVMRLLGPNCLGLLVPPLKLNASFSQADALAGDLAFVSQSGALATAVIDTSRAHGIGFSHLISLGEHADVDFGDLLDYLGSDPGTRAILLYVESVSSPRKFMSAARAASRNKPVIVVKAGRAGAGVQAAASHTGALAGSDIVYDAAFRRAGVLRVDTLQQLFDAAETLSRFKGRTDRGLHLVTNGGGAGVLAADAAARLGVEIPPLPPALLATLDAALPVTWSHGNPVDLIGDAPVGRYVAALEALLADPSGPPVLFMHAPTAIVPSADIAQACMPLVAKHASRLMACWLGADSVAAARRRFEAAGVADYDTPERAVEAFSMLGTFRRNQALLLEAPPARGDDRAVDAVAVRRILDGAFSDGRTMIDESEAKALLAAYGIPVVPSLRTDPNPSAAAEAALGIDGPYALKILSPDLSHKSDVGGVALGLPDAEAVRMAAIRMLARLEAEHPTARLTGFSVQPMAQRPRAHELIVGASVDSVFGPVLLFGQGGTAVEVVADRAIGLPPMNRALARELVSRTRVAKLLAGYRDRPAADLDAIADVLIALSRMQAELPQLAELDINPLWADEHGVVALDARVRLDRACPAGADRFAIRPYPGELVRRVAWGDHLITVRPIRPEDEAQHRRFLARVSPDDMRLRFFDTRRTLPDSELARLVQIDYAREMAFIAERPRLEAPGAPGAADAGAADAGAVDGETTETLGVVRAVCDPDNDTAEFALLVRSDLHGRGLGTLLMNTLTDTLRAAGTRRVVGDVLSHNGAMRDLLHELGFVTVRGGIRSDSVRYERLLQRA